jgi:hypothetical protein
MYLPYTRQTLSSATDYWVYNTVQLPASPSLGAVSVTASALGDMFNPSVLPIPPVSDLVPNRYLIGGTIYYASEPTYIRKLSYPSGALEGITGGVRSDVYDATGSVIVESYINSGYSVNTLTGVMASTPAELANTMSPIFFNTGLFGAGLAATDWAAGSAYEKFTSTVIGNTYFIFDYSTTQVKQNPPTPVATNKTLAQVLAAGVNSSNDSVVYNLSNGAITATPVAGSVASYMASIPRPNKTFTTYVMLYQLADGNVYMGEVMKDGAVTGGNSYMTATGLNYSQNYEIRLNEAAVSSLSLALATK